MTVYVNRLSEYEDEIREVAKRVMMGEKLKGELSVTFVGDERMIELNGKYLGREDTTDVLSFPFSVPELLGDIYICLPQAKRQKKGDLINELKLLTIHGILHLAGYDDRNDSMRKKMREKEEEYLKE
ncbi:rRNA maturation RNase YbeY [candidate division WOR-3 bacterium]|nr:rRNA maturation RNase YbeY [candidate division WOR-3 bacterium]